MYLLLGSLIITTSNITNNIASDIGILNLEGDEILIKDSLFTFNQAHLGMIYLTDNKLLKFSNTTMMYNNVSTKGVLYAQDSNIEGSGMLIIKGNIASLGIVYIVRCNASLLSTFTFINNSASFTAINSNLVVYGDSVFIENGVLKTFAEGGAITTIQSTMSLYGYAKIEDNFSASSGGGIYAVESIVEMFNNVSLKYNKAYSSGGGMHMYSSVLICEQYCEISSNEAGLGGGIHAIGSSISVSRPQVKTV